MEGISIDNAKSKFHLYCFPKPILIFHILQDEKPSSSSNKTTALKQNIPLFQRKFPLAIKSMCNLVGFFSKRNYIIALRSVSRFRFVGTIPKVTIYPFAAFYLALAASYNCISSIIWSDG
jgi:hypothetical protein